MFKKLSAFILVLLVFLAIKMPTFASGYDFFGNGWVDIYDELSYQSSIDEYGIHHNLDTVTFNVTLADLSPNTNHYSTDDYEVICKTDDQAANGYEADVLFAGYADGPDKGTWSYLRVGWGPFVNYNPVDSSWNSITDNSFTYVLGGTHSISVNCDTGVITVDGIQRNSPQDMSLYTGEWTAVYNTGYPYFDSLNNIETSPSLPWANVHAAPTTTISLAPNPDSQNQYPNPANVTLQATADTGYTIAHTYFTVDGGSQQTYSAPFTVSGTGSHTVTYWSVDSAALEETPHKSQTFTVSSTTIDTPLPTGQNQTATIGNATLTFSDVTTAGYVVQTTSSSNAGGALPSEYKLLGNYYVLTTTATYTGTITITMSYDPAAVHNQNQLKLWHFDGTTWNDITTTVDTVNHTITGVTSSLSPFAIGEKDVTPPTLTNFQLNPYVVANGSSSTISVNALDDLTGVHAVSYSLTSGSGQVTTGDLNFINPSGVWQATVSPTTGVYAVKVTATDVAGNHSASDNLYVAVYDPSAGYVTGGGWVTPNDNTRIGVSSGGKANFGFNVKYLSGSSTPDGSLEMNDKQDSLDFKTTSLEWLTVSGSTADFQGQVTLNGTGSYTFRAHVVDGSPDQYDIRVWGSSNSFDNPNYRISNSLGGGSIVIHQ